MGDVASPSNCIGCSDPGRLRILCRSYRFPRGGTIDPAPERHSRGAGRHIGFLQVCRAVIMHADREGRARLNDCSVESGGDQPSSAMRRLRSASDGEPSRSARSASGSGGSALVAPPHAGASDCPSDASDRTSPTRENAGVSAVSVSTSPPVRSGSSAFGTVEIDPTFGKNAVGSIRSLRSGKTITAAKTNRLTRPGGPDLRAFVLRGAGRRGA
jgi:hypothetical protein